MYLTEYLVRKRMTQTELAKLIGTSRQHINNIIHHRVPCGRKLALRIEKATSGEVSAFEVLSLRLPRDVTPYQAQIHNNFVDDISMQA